LNKEHGILNAEGLSDQSYISIFPNVKNYYQIFSPQWQAILRQKIF
jgi:hypothetical protein